MREVDSVASGIWCHVTILTTRAVPTVQPGSLACMPEADEAAGAGEARVGGGGQRPGTLSGFGAASAVLAVLAVIAVAAIAVLWSGHRGAEGERTHQARAMQAAADWTAVLINMNADNVEASMARLRDGTVGDLNTGFEAAIAPYRDVVRTLRSRTSGQVESVSIEELHNNLDTKPGERPAPAALPPDLATRTDTVLVVATSVSENAGNKPTTVRWNLRLGVSEVEGTAMISRLESMR